MSKAGRQRRKTSTRADQGRQHLAYEIARLMWEYRIEDFRLAKDKAIRQLGLRQADLPDNREIARELTAYSALFAPEQARKQSTERIKVAWQLLTSLAAYQPRMTGLEAQAVDTPGAALQIHIFSDHPEQFDLELQSRGLDYELIDKRYRFGTDDYDTRPCYVFEVDGVTVRVTVFATSARSRIPLSAVDGKPMKRYSLRELEVMAKYSESG